MSANTIHFDATTREWNLNGQVFIDRRHAFSDSNLSFGKEQNVLRVVTGMRDADLQPLTGRSLGELVGFARENGIDTLEFDSCTLTVTYIDKMLSFKARNDWFVDFLVDTDDHKFNSNDPTPGGRWSEVRKLFADAEKADAAALAAGALYRDDLVQQAREDARLLRQEASELLADGK